MSADHFLVHAADGLTLIAHTADQWATFWEGVDVEACMLLGRCDDELDNSERAA